MALSSTHRVLTRYSRGTHRVLTRAVDRTVRCAPPPGRGPTARSAAHVCGTTACTLRWASGIARRGTWLAMLAGYSTGTPGPSTACTEAHPSASTAAVCCRPTLCTVICRVRSADARSDTRADQRRRHQPAHARADDHRADARAELRRPDG
jgi:hypothetical protein